MIIDHYLRFVFLLITRMTLWLQQSRREETWKTTEILILCHARCTGGNSYWQEWPSRRAGWRPGG
jgi:hypothetical protein